MLFGIKWKISRFLTRICKLLIFNGHKNCIYIDFFLQKLHHCKAWRHIDLNRSKTQYKTPLEFNFIISILKIRESLNWGPKWNIELKFFVILCTSFTCITSWNIINTIWFYLWILHSWYTIQILRVKGWGSINFIIFLMGLLIDMYVP